jgi:hypothetical protein
MGQGKVSKLWKCCSKDIRSNTQKNGNDSQERNTLNVIQHSAESTILQQNNTRDFLTPQPTRKSLDDLTLQDVATMFRRNNIDVRGEAFDSDGASQWQNEPAYQTFGDETWAESELQGQSDARWLEPIRSSDTLLVIANDSKDYGEIFKDIKGKTIEDIIARVPREDDANVSHFREIDKSGENMQAFKYIWTDDTRRIKWILTVHSPNPSSPEWSICRTNWTARLVRWQVGSGEGNNYFMDRSGNFHHQDLALREHDDLYDGSATNDEEIIENTHIPIATPQNYICPIEHPEHYGRKKSQRG